MEKEKCIRLATLLNDSKVKTIGPSFKLSNNEIMNDGETIVISQDKEYSVGFTNRVDQKLQNPPYIVFGDHTECLKWVATPFAQGADGVKILKTNSADILDRYLYYALLTCYNKTGFINIELVIIINH